MNKKLADDITEETYEETPIENYGMKLLNKMMSNKNNNLLNRKRANVIEFKPRNHRCGLGYDVDNIVINKKGQHDEKSFYGTRVKVIKGKFKGMTGVVLSEGKGETFKQFLLSNKKVKVQLELNSENIFIDNDGLEMYNEEVEKNSESESESQHEEKEEKEELTWLVQGIIVRIIAENSKYYNTKAKVYDIIDKCCFSLLTNDNTIHNEFCENDCETVIPKIGELVIVLAGEHRNEAGKLVQRDKKENKVVVQLLTDMSLITLTQDDVSMKG